MKLLESTAAKYRSPKLSASSGTQVRPWLLAWLGLPVLGIANGALRDATYKRATGELAAHQLSTATLLGLMTAYIWTLQRRWPISTSREAFTIGGSWALLTILFEFGFGHYVTGGLLGGAAGGLQPGRGAGLGDGAGLDRGWAGVHQEAQRPPLTSDLLDREPGKCCSRGVEASSEWGRLE